MKSWYMVKRNWVNDGDDSCYAGLDGDWGPLSFESVEGTALQATCPAIHRRFEQLQEWIRVEGWDLIVCTDIEVAAWYKREVDKRFSDAWLLELCRPQDQRGPVDGYDLGNPEGGYSVVGHEIMSGLCRGPELNQWRLIDSMEDVERYLELRKECDNVEEIEMIKVVAIRVLESPFGPCSSKLIPPRFWGKES